MKAKVITIHSIFNYGSILQAYATQRLFESAGASVSLIDYRPATASAKVFSRARARDSILSLGNRALKNIIGLGADRRYRKRYSKAVETLYNPMGRQFSNIGQLITEAPEADLYIAGSDQIWHPRSSAKDTAYFLSFGDSSVRKVSYASSFGCVGLPADIQTHYRESLDNFDLISVREGSAVRLVRELTGRVAVQVLDPTLMLTENEWRAEAIPSEVSKPYVLCYGYSPNSKYMESVAIKIAERTGWSIVRLNGNAFDLLNPKIHYVLDAGPREWLGYFLNARFVLGQSFHATAFALNFGVPFLSILRGDANHDSRQLEFLEMIEMKDRALAPEDSIDFVNHLSREPNFIKSHRRLQEEREISNAFVDQSLKE